MNLILNAIGKSVQSNFHIRQYTILDLTLQLLHLFYTLQIII
jgi:hypothetical protein